MERLKENVQFVPCSACREATEFGSPDGPELCKECLERKPVQNPGYHLRQINRGKFGTLSKVQEELDEAKDAEEQKVGLMVLNELSDVIGAIGGYLERNFPGISIEDLHAMAKCTTRAFQNGRRK